uniref:Uncharacterized protein n=1 Tax=Anguilla anguilla TaxID=7936 RepID=A0A0E9WIB4_ANGAN
MTSAPASYHTAERKSTCTEHELEEDCSCAAEWVDLQAANQTAGDSAQ